MKKILHLTSWGVSSIDQVFAFSTNENLSGDGHFGALFITNWRSSFVIIAENNSDCCLVHTSLTLFVDQFREAPSTYLTEIGNTENKTNGI